MAEERNREKTYLLILSFLIIASLFVDIRIDTINILGNEATVPEGFVEIAVLLMWVYFLWIHYQSSPLNSYKRRKSESYLSVLHKRSHYVIRNYVEMIGFFNGPEKLHDDALRGSPRVGTFLEAEPVHNGLKIPVTYRNPAGDLTPHEKELIIPRSKIRLSRFLANLSYLANDVSFSQYIFPYIMAALAAISITLQLAGINFAPPVEAAPLCPETNP